MLNTCFLCSQTTSTFYLPDSHSDIGSGRHLRKSWRHETGRVLIFLAPAWAATNQAPCRDLQALYGLNKQPCEGSSQGLTVKYSPVRLPHLTVRFNRLDVPLYYLLFASSLQNLLTLLSKLNPFLLQSF